MRKVIKIAATAMPAMVPVPRAPGVRALGARLKGKLAGANDSGIQKKLGLLMQLILHALTSGRGQSAATMHSSEI